ncbi:MAG: Na+/H+ antiporter subunit C [Steroidobacteraceae bacterium]|nr:Na+/H+ antiporter subunit C [Steroidobacteraceae bacterium]MDW8260674.1 Na+/H+ antiporter subunit C [Gammaproteobacteria bacterium]
MALMLALAVALLTSCGVFLLLRPRMFPVVLGLLLTSYAVNLLLLLAGRVGDFAPPLMIDRMSARPADPLPQALVLTAIVIGFGMTAYLVALALKSQQHTGSDRVDDEGPEP